MVSGSTSARTNNEEKDMHMVLDTKKPHEGKEEDKGFAVHRRSWEPCWCKSSQDRVQWSGNSLLWIFGWRATRFRDRHHGSPRKPSEELKCLQSGVLSSHCASSPSVFVGLWQFLTWAQATFLQLPSFNVISWCGLWCDLWCDHIGDLWSLCNSVPLAAEVIMQYCSECGSHLDDRRALTVLHK